MMKWISLVLIIFCCSVSYAEQYRSKLLVNPNQSLGESVQLSVEELEAQFSRLEGDFARASAGRHLAHHYVRQNEYEKAVEYYQKALQADGLSEILNQQMRKDLASVYLLMKKPQEALSVLAQISPLQQVTEAQVALLYGKAALLLKQYIQVSDALDKAIELESQPTEDFYQQVLALSFKIDQFDRSEWALNQLINQNQAEPSYWTQLATVHTKQGEYKEALSVLMLAQQKGFALDEQTLLLKSDLYASLKAPFQAAELLKKAIESGRVKDTGENYRKLFEYQLMAKETEAALESVRIAASKTGSMELYFYWIDLLMKEKQWQEMNRVVLQACKAPITLKTVGRINLLLGISELKLGNIKDAQEAFENALVAGGVNKQAGDWLRYMGDERVGVRSKKSVSGPCRVNSR